MKRILGLGLALALAIPAAALAGDDSFVVNDSNKPINHDCGKQAAVLINGSMDTITLTGTCTKVLINGRGNTLAIESSGKVGVNGAANTVTIGATDKIELTGSQNKVTWKRGLTKKAPKVMNLGNHNSIAKTK